jgi:hypothetical protein
MMRYEPCGYDLPVGRLLNRREALLALAKTAGGYSATFDIGLQMS